jgi:hypothetical protein
MSLNVQTHRGFTLRALAAVLALFVAMGGGSALLAAGPAHASNKQYSFMQDDDLLLYSGDVTRDQTLARMKQMGVQAVRVTVLWSVIANGTKDPRKHRSRRKPTDPRFYPTHNWDRYDRLVRTAKSIGLGVLFDVTGPGPSWAMGKTNIARIKKSYMPNVGYFQQFVTALGTRYSGSYTSPTDHQNVPRVNFWAIWNEPNQPGWLAPQAVYSNTVHHVIAYSPILYRRLWFAGYRALAATGHITTGLNRDVVLAGETAPIGSSPTDAVTPIPAALFTRELFCVGRSLHSYRGADASARDCGSFARTGPITPSAWAHHPYSVKTAPNKSQHVRDGITLDNISALPKLLDRIASTTGRVTSGLPIFLTEYGFETNPPDPFRGLAPDTQAAYLNQADYMAFKQRRIGSTTQFLLVDAPPNPLYRAGTARYWNTFQDGLYYRDGTAKPAAQAYVFPFWIQRAAGDQLELWTQLRFRNNYPPAVSSGQDSVLFQFRPPGATAWQNIKGAQVTNPAWFVDQTLPNRGAGFWRVVWFGPVYPNVVASREIRVH